ncbi:unnamed protein product [Parnassius mnemosyne]|uniref:RNase H type-1 domain-containing protein n=1 Tax=Parnassius mnemosyne TaxID=213953 RepID=A0AAV1MBU7_9NEOP
MESELSVPPLNIRRLYLAYKYVLKASSFSNNVTINLLKQLSTLCETRYWQRKKIPLLVKSYNKTKIMNIQSSPFLESFSLSTWLSRIDIENILLSKLESVKQSKKLYEKNSLKLNIIEEFENKYHDWHKIYTDGSKSAKFFELASRAAFFDSSRAISRCYKVTNDVCIMTLELIAISEALRYAASYNWNKIIVYSDSKTAIQHLARSASGIRGVSIAYTILSQLYEFSLRDICARVQWIPSHIGLLGNEEADRLANSACVNGVEYNINPCYSEFFVKCGAKTCLITSIHLVRCVYKPSRAWKSGKSHLTTSV